jgi:hypothetical protein
MTVEAPYSRYRKTNFKIAIFGGLLLAIILGYDGYLSKYEWSYRQSFYREHTKDGVPDVTMKANRAAPFVLAGISIIAAVWFFRIKNIRVVADENQLIIGEKEKIPYKSIQQIDKTYFDTKGFFIITYKTADGSSTLKAFSYKRYDNLKALLEYLVTKIT